MIILDFLSIPYKLCYLYLLLRLLLLLFRLKYQIKLIIIFTLKSNYRNIEEIMLMNKRELIIAKRNNI